MRKLIAPRAPADPEGSKSGALFAGTCRSFLCCSSSDSLLRLVPLKWSSAWCADTSAASAPSRLSARAAGRLQPGKHAHTQPFAHQFPSDDKTPGPAARNRALPASPAGKSSERCRRFKGRRWTKRECERNVTRSLIGRSGRRRQFIALVESSSDERADPDRDWPDLCATSRETRMALVPQALDRVRQLPAPPSPRSDAGSA